MLIEIHSCVYHILHDLTADTPDATINNIIRVFCACLIEAIAYKIVVEELETEEAKDFIRKAIGASISSHHIAQDDLLQMQEEGQIA